MGVAPLFYCLHCDHRSRWDDCCRKTFLDISRCHSWLPTNSVEANHIYLAILKPFSRWTWVSWYQNVSILDFIGAKDDGDGGNNWSYKTCKAPVIMSPPTNQHPVFLQARCPACRPTNSVKALKGSEPHWTASKSNLMFKYIYHPADMSKLFTKCPIHHRDTSVYKSHASERAKFLHNLWDNAVISETTADNTQHEIISPMTLFSGAGGMIRPWCKCFTTSFSWRPRKSLKRR